MLVAVTSAGPERSSELDTDFGSARFVLFIDLVSGQLEVLDNRDKIDAGAMAGVRMAREILDRHPEWVLTGSIGPKAFQILSEAGIRTGTGASGTVRDTLKQFDLGEFDYQEEPVSLEGGNGADEKADESGDTDLDSWNFQTGDPNFPTYRPQISSKRSDQRWKN